MFASVYTSGGGPIPIVSSGGWTTLYTPASGFGLGGYTRLRVFYRRIDGTEVDPVIGNHTSSGSCYYNVGIAQYADIVSAGSPLDGIIPTPTVSFGATLVSPEYTTTVADSIILHFAAANDAAPYPFDIPGNTRRISAGNMTVCDVPKVTPGTLAAGNWSVGGGAQSKYGYVIALLGSGVPAVPISDFTYASSGAPGVSAPILFSDNTLNSPTSWAWAFGDGTTSTARNPSHAYSAAGTYSVTLTTTNAQGSNSITKSVNVSGATIIVPYVIAPNLKTSPGIAFTFTRMTLWSSTAKVLRTTSLKLRPITWSYYNLPSRSDITIKAHPITVRPMMIHASSDTGAGSDIGTTGGGVSIY